LILRICSALGLFKLTSRWCAHRLHILCYHGFQLADECRFRPQLFISHDTFTARLARLSAMGFTVLPLAEAIRRLHDGTLPPRAASITIDDGFYSTLSVASPLLREYVMPATVYVTTYYAEKRVPVFRLAVQYVLWRAAAAPIDANALASLADERGARGELDRDALTWKLIRRGEQLHTEGERQELLRQIARLCAVDLTPLYAQKLLSIVSAEEISELAQQGFDVQLHTHRHRFPATDQAQARREIEENRAFLEPLTHTPCTHFCYPSGIFASSQWPWLAALDVESATTCLPGLNHRDTPPYGLRRFLDSEDIEPIEFYAELAGFNELLRKILIALRLRTSDTQSSPAPATGA
jgi:peptidoglycan/xylan/chitin deacetylase (PgdA/CDA1 family)